MATLAAVNQTLLEQNEVLGGIVSNTGKTSTQLSQFISSLKGERLKDLEDQREAKQSGRTGGMISALTGKAKAGAAGLGNLLSGAGLAGFAAAAGTRLVYRGIPGLLAIGFADEIADYLLGPDGDKDVRKAIEGAITGGAIGALFGKKALVIGTLIGSVASNKTVSDELDKLGDNVNTFLKNLGFNVGDTAAETGKTGLAFISETIGDGLKGVNALFEGDYAGFAEDWKSVLATFGGLALLISPKLTLGAGKMTVRGLMQAFKFAGPKGKAIATALAAFGVTLSTTGDSQQTAPGGMTDAERDSGAGISSGTATALGVGAVAGGAVYGLTRNQKDAIAGRGKYSTPTVTATPPKKKAKAGYTYDEKAKRFRNVTTGEFAKAADVEILQRFPRLAKLFSFLGKGNPVLNMIFSSAAIATIILDDETYPTTKSKSKAIAKELAGAFGGIVLGAAVGTILGMMGLNPITIGIGAFGGSIGGYFLGEYMAAELMEFLLGGNPSSVKPSAQSNMSSLPMSMGTTETGGMISGIADRNMSMANLIRDEAIAQGVDPELALGVAQTESSFNPTAIGDGGKAHGLFQMWPIAVKDVNDYYGTNFTDSDRMDPKKNAKMGLMYLRMMKSKYGATSTEQQLAMYNRGPTAISAGNPNQLRIGAAYAGKVDRAMSGINVSAPVTQVANNSPLLLPFPQVENSATVRDDIPLSFAFSASG